MIDPKGITHIDCGALYIILCTSDPEIVASNFTRISKGSVQYMSADVDVIVIVRLHNVRYVRLLVVRV